MHYLIAKCKDLSPVRSPWSYSCNCHCLFFKFFLSMVLFYSGYPPASLLANFQLFPLVCMCMLSCFTCVWILVTVWTVTCQALLSMGILQARILEWVSMPSFRGSSQPRDRTQVSHIAGGFFTRWAIREALIFVYFSTKMAVKGFSLKA